MGKNEDRGETIRLKFHPPDNITVSMLYWEISLQEEQ